MKVYTKTGDKGSTGLYGGKRISKAALRIESYGNVDELNSFMGLIRDMEHVPERKQLLKRVQDNLFNVGSILSCDKEVLPASIPKVSISDIQELELAMDDINELLEPLTAFVLPGGHPKNSYCHIARCVCRRAERAVVRLDEIEGVDQLVIIYLNRLSDYLFMLARLKSKEEGVEEIKWESKPKKKSKKTA